MIFITIPDRVVLESALSELMCAASARKCEVLLSCAGTEFPVMEVAEALVITAGHDCRSFHDRIYDFVERVVPDPNEQRELLAAVQLLSRTE